MNESHYISFGKDKTALIKGVAIVFMIVLHVFGGPGWYEPQYDLPLNHNAALLKFMGSLQICVGIYVFMIGFGYAHSKKKDFQYSVKHIKHLLSVYWMILLLFVWPVNTSNLAVGGDLLYLNMLGIKEDLSWVSWFVFLYIWAMIIMPFVGRLIDKRPYLYSLSGIMISYVLMCIIHFLNPKFGDNVILYPLFVSLSWTPTIIIGYLFARKQLFQKIKVPHKWWTVVSSIALITLCLWLKSNFKGISIFNFDIIYSPLVITAILIVFTVIKWKWLIWSFAQFGDKSVYMWFIHGLFFTAATRHFYQPYIMISDNLWLIALWAIVLSYLISIPLKKILDL